MSKLIDKKMRLASEKSSINLVGPMLFNVKDVLNISDEKFYNLLIAVTEAVNNAIIHGNRLNPEKYVDLALKGDKTYIEIVVKDQGDGFDPDAVADCREPENLLKESGRGVFIIRSLLDEASFVSTGNGTTVRMKYYLQNK